MGESEEMTVAAFTPKDLYPHQGPKLGPILVVDNDPEICDMISRAGTAQGFNVATATESRLFGALFERLSPKIIMLDIFMPDIDGIELIGWLITEGFDGKVIVMSGHDPVYMQFAELYAEIKGKFEIAVLPKPFSLQQLRQALVDDRPVIGV